MPLPKFLAALVLLPVLLAPLRSQAEPLYSIHLLPAGFTPSDINNAGQMAGQLRFPLAGSNAAFYDGNAVTDLASLVGTASVATAINEAGAVAGTFTTASGEAHAFIYRNGSIVDIGAGTSAYGINDSGDVVGFSARTVPHQAFVYRDGVITELGGLGTGIISIAYDINAAGQVVGESNLVFDRSAPTHPFLVDHGAMHDLGAPRGARMNAAQAINDAGVIAGHSAARDGAMHAFVVEDGVMRDAGTFGEPSLEVTGINEYGQFTGFFYRAATQHHVGFVYRDGALHELSTLLDPATGWAIEDAYGINDAGQIAALGCRTDGSVCSSMRLDPTSAIPEPAAFLLLLPGLLPGLLAVLRPRRSRASCSQGCRPFFQRFRRYVMHLRTYAVVLALLAPFHSQAAPLYTAVFLPDVDFAPTGMNNAGHIVGFAGAGTGAIHAVLYANGMLSDLGSLGGRDSYAQAINDAGAITGSTLLASGEQHAFLYRDGSVTDLGAGTAGYGINAHGAVVGSKLTADGVTGFVYSDGTLTELGNPGTGTNGMAVGINDHGTIAGDAATGPDASTSPRHPFLYHDGTLHDLGALGGHAVTGVVAINNAGQVAGYSGEPDAYTHAFLYERGVMRDLGGVGDGALEIHDLNIHGTLVGTAFNEDDGLIPFMSLGDALVDLNTLLDPALGWRIFSAYANNDLGQIVAYGCRDAMCGLVRLDLASAVPEPGAALMLLPGLLILAGARRRQSSGGTMPSIQALPALALPTSLEPVVGGGA